MTLSVIVPTYAMTPAVHDLWESNRAEMERVATVPTEIIVVDNGSKYFPKKMTTTWRHNRGVAPAWNEGVSNATGTVLAFVTSTTRVMSGWDAKLCAVAQSGRYIAMPLTNGIKNEGIGITGWCWVLTRALWDEIGPFDETFVPVQYEDTDYFHRAINQGAELVTVRGANVCRAGRHLSYAGTPVQALRIHMANRWRYAWKHDVDPNDVPPFWKTPLRDVEVPQ